MDKNESEEDDEVGGGEDLSETIDDSGAAVISDIAPSVE